MKIYTKGGDKGQTSLYDGTRVSKFDGRIELLGDLDELNAHIGWLISLLQANKHLTKSPFSDELARAGKILLTTQSRLFEIGSEVADPQASGTKTYDYSTATTELETFIDELTGKLPILGNFILPGGSYAASVCHLCRTIARRTERRFFSVAGETPANATMGPYLNRLSDLFFTLARFVNKALGQEDVVWQKESVREE